MNHNQDRYFASLEIVVDRWTGVANVRVLANDGSTPIDVRGVPVTERARGAILEAVALQMSLAATQWLGRPALNDLPEGMRMIAAYSQRRCRPECRAVKDEVLHARGCELALELRGAGYEVRELPFSDTGSEDRNPQ